MLEGCKTGICLGELVIYVSHDMISQTACGAEEKDVCCCEGAVDGQPTSRREFLACFCYFENPCDLDGGNLGVLFVLVDFC